MDEFRSEEERLWAEARERVFAELRRGPLVGWGWREILGSREGEQVPAGQVDVEVDPDGGAAGS